MEQECLDKQQPQCDGKHRAHRQRKKSARAFRTKSGEGSETECGEIRESAESCDRDAADLGVTTPEHLETTGRSLADRRFTGESLHQEVNCFGEANQRKQSGDSKDSGPKA